MQPEAEEKFDNLNTTVEHDRLPLAVFEMSITADCKSVARILISFAVCVQMRCVCVETSMEGRKQRTGLKCCGLPSFSGLWNVQTGLCVCCVLESCCLLTGIPAAPSLDAVRLFTTVLQG